MPQTQGTRGAKISEHQNERATLYSIQTLDKPGRMKLRLPQKSSSKVKQCFLVSQGGAKCSRAEVPEGRIPEERFEFNEDVEDNWSEMEIPCGEQERTSATKSPEVIRTARKAHRGLGHTATSKFLRMLRLGGVREREPLQQHLRMQHMGVCATGKPP